jgi:hypothetical protein
MPAQISRKSKPEEAIAIAMQWAVVVAVAIITMVVALREVLWDSEEWRGKGRGKRKTAMVLAAKTPDQAVERRERETRAIAAIAIVVTLRKRLKVANLRRRRYAQRMQQMRRMLIR